MYRELKYFLGGYINGAENDNIFYSVRLIASILVRGAKRLKDGDFLRAESFCNVATNIEALDAWPGFTPPVKSGYGGKSLHEQSRCIVFPEMVFIFWMSRRPHYLPPRLMSLLVQIEEADIFTISPTAIQLTPYRKTENYVLTNQFLNNPYGMLQQLLDPTDLDI